ncbi:uncharacterized protein LOC129358371 [Poeciliopsis prolifica]|uniref:uncharacterized protein LOC129358371 n=1 Tax=Poeciliopsis prolifica TaxID=188132 RepID=UPI0024137DCF|nr:uncharacterized protein LOC129358371 [Poeciliopsis prolifica]
MKRINQQCSEDQLNTFENQQVHAAFQELQNEISQIAISPETRSLGSTDTQESQAKSFPLKGTKSSMGHSAGQHPNPVTCNVADTYENQDVLTVLKKLQSEVSDTSNSPETQSLQSAVSDNGGLKSFPQKTIKSFTENVTGQRPNPVTCSVPGTFENQAIRTAFKELQNQAPTISIDPQTQNIESAFIDDGQLISCPNEVIKTLAENVAGQRPNPVPYSEPGTFENQEVRATFKELQKHVSGISISPHTQNLESADFEKGHFKSFPGNAIKSFIKNVAGQHFTPGPCTASVQVPSPESYTASVQVPSPETGPFVQFPSPEPCTAFEHVPYAEKSTPFNFFKRPATGTIPSKLRGIGRKHDPHVPNIGEQGTSKSEVAALPSVTKRDLDSVEAGLPGDTIARIRHRAGQDNQEKGIQCFEHGIAQGEDDLTDCEFHCKTCKSNVKPSVLKEFISEVSDLLQCQTCKHEVYIISAVINRLLEKYPRDSKRLLLWEQSGVLKRRLSIYLSAHLGIQKCNEVDRKLNSDYYAKVIVNNLLGIYGSPRKLITAAVLPDSNFCDDFVAFVGCELVKTRAYKKYDTDMSAWTGLLSESLCLTRLKIHFCHSTAVRTHLHATENALGGMMNSS